MSSRDEVYAAIDTEREYQDYRWGGYKHNASHEIESFVMYTEYYIRKATDILCVEDLTSPVYRAKVLTNLRKAAALLVCAMEIYGALPREAVYEQKKHE